MVERLTRVPGIVLITVAAVMWGTDALFRRPLARSTSAATIVFGEHVILVALTQWVGVGIVVAVVSLLPIQRRRTVVAVPPADARLVTAAA